MAQRDENTAPENTDILTDDEEALGSAETDSDDPPNPVDDPNNIPPPPTRPGG